MPQPAAATAVSHEKRPAGLCAWLNEYLPHLSGVLLFGIAVFEAVMVCIVGPLGGA